MARILKTRITSCNECPHSRYKNNYGAMTLVRMCSIKLNRWKSWKEVIIFKVEKTYYTWSRVRTKRVKIPMWCPLEKSK
jgi:hypothetical protein